MTMNELPKRKRRWYRFTPDRFIVGLLAVEGFLLLSERLRWFAFNEKKGFTLLVAAAAVCLGVLFLLLWLGVSLLLRRRFQFGVRSLLVLVLVVAIAGSWLAVKLEKARRQRRAVIAFEKMGASVKYDYQWDEQYQLISEAEPPGLPWLRKLLGQHFFACVTDIEGTKPDITDTGLVHLNDLPNLEELALTNTLLTDEGMIHVGRLTKLKWCYLAGTAISDAGLAHLENLTNLEVLDLRGTSISDDGLAHLKALISLRELRLSGLALTDDGLLHLKSLPNLDELWLDSPNLTDAGLVHLADMDNLCILYIGTISVFDWLQAEQQGTRPPNSTRVTPEGVKKLQQALPACEIVY